MTSTIPPEQLEKLKPVLDALERDFRPLVNALPPDAPSVLVFPCEPEDE
jgi:hypothetical protein